MARAPSSQPTKIRDSILLVTGASSGIGEALVREAAAQGAAVVLLARRAERIARIASEIEAQGGRALAIACDVTHETELDTAVARTLEHFGRLDVAIANAGFGVGGNVDRLSLDDYRRQFETNLFGVIRTVHATLPALTRARGALALMGSTNGYVSVPGWSAYCASKHALRSLAVCLRHELARSGVSVTHLAPGFVESEIRLLDARGTLNPDAIDPIPSWLQMPAASAARAMLKAIEQRRAETAITLHSRVAILAERHAPWLVSLSLRAGGALFERFSASSTRVRVAR